MIDGEERKYLGTDYEPKFPFLFEELRTVDEIDTLITRYRLGRTDVSITRYRLGRTDVSNEIASIDSDIKETNDNILSLKNEINEKGG